MTECICGTEVLFLTLAGFRSWTRDLTLTVLLSHATKECKWHTDNDKGICFAMGCVVLANVSENGRISLRYDNLGIFVPEAFQLNKMIRNPSLV